MWALSQEQPNTWQCVIYCPEISCDLHAHDILATSSLAQMHHRKEIHHLCGHLVGGSFHPQAHPKLFPILSNLTPVNFIMHIIAHWYMDIIPSPATFFSRGGREREG